SGSMEPALQVGDLAVVSPTPPDQLAVGDVITYRTPARPGIPVTHRIVNISRDAQGQLEFQTKGDANNEVDSVAADQSGVVGRVAREHGRPRAALALAVRAIAAEPHADQARPLQADCLPPGAERLASLHAGLPVNPGPSRLLTALHAATAAEAATG